MIRQVLVTLLAMSCFVGCSEAPNDSTSLGRVVGSFGPQEADAAFIQLLRQKAPALQIGVIDQRESSVLLLEAQRGGIETWRSQDGVTVILDEGMLVGTRGFGGGLLAADVSQPKAMIKAGKEGPSDRFLTFLNDEDRAVTRTYRCVIKRQGAREIKLANRTAQTLLMKEECRSLDQSFFNLYWVDRRGGKIIQSRQWAGDFVGALSTRVVEN